MGRRFASFFAVLLAAVALMGAAHARRRDRLPTPPRSSRPMPTSREAGYGDSLAGARQLKAAVDALIKAPTDANLKAARAGVARGARALHADRGLPLRQQDRRRLGGQGQRLAARRGPDRLRRRTTTATESRRTSSTPPTSSPTRAQDRRRDGRRLQDHHGAAADKLQEAGGVEANVATGYHAIEFLLWGQDLNGTGPGAGNRPATDYDPKNCTGGNCDRRAHICSVATDLLVDDLTWMAEQWGPDGAARKAVHGGRRQGRPRARIFTGLGSLSYGELAGERMKLGLMLHDPEEEHDCFSDNTHNSHYYDVLGIQNVYLGSYKRTDGTVVTGPSAVAISSRQVGRDRRRARAQRSTTTDAAHERDREARAKPARPTTR